MHVMGRYVFLSCCFSFYFVSFIFLLEDASNLKKIKNRCRINKALTLVQTHLGLNSAFVTQQLDDLGEDALVLRLHFLLHKMSIFLPTKVVAVYWGAYEKVESSVSDRVLGFESLSNG